MMQQIVLFIHLCLAFLLIGLVLMQHGKGADAGAAFGSGASGTVFGSAGSGSFLTRLTTFIAVLFAITSVSLTLLANKATRPETLTDKLIKAEVNTQQAPAELASDAPEVKSTEVPEIPQ